MKTSLSVLLATSLLLCSSFVPEPALPAQIGIVPCKCKGEISTLFNPTPCLVTGGQAGSIESGRCHKDSPSGCTMAAEPCQYNVTVWVNAKPTCHINFQFKIDGVVQPGGGIMPSINRTATGELSCGQERVLQITADGEPVLITIINCHDCSG